jgi:hypothetical protein
MAQFQSRVQWRWKIPKEIKLPVGLLYLSFLTSALLSLSVYFSLQPVIPLFYTLTQPEQQLVAKHWIFVFPTIVGLISIVHSYILYRMQEGHMLLLQLFSWTSILISFLFLLSQIRIILLVT